MIVAFADRSSRTHRRHQRRRSSNSSSKNSKQSSDGVPPYDKRQSDGSRSSQRSHRSYHKKNSSSSRRNKKSSTTRRSSGGSSRSSKKTHKSPVEIRKDNVMLDELDKHIPPALEEQDVKKREEQVVVSETPVYRPRRRESTDDPRISWGSSVLRPGMPGRRDSQSSVGSEVIVEFPKEQRRPSYNSTSSSGRVITDNLSLCGFMKRRKSKGGGSITGISLSDRTSSSCPAKPQLCTDRRCHHKKRTHTSTRHFKHTVDWRTSSIDWGDSTDDECSSMCGTVDGSDDDDDDDGSEFVPQRIVRRGRDPAGHYSGRNLLDRSVYSDRIDSSENTGRTLSESFSSLLSGTFRKPDP